MRSCEEMDLRAGQESRGKALWFLLLVLMSMVGQVNAAPPFPLGDLDPDSPVGRQRFLGSFGINEAIEPTLSQEDRPLYESLAPYLRNDPRRAIQIATAGMTSQSNAAFDFLVGNLYYQVGDYFQSERYLQQAVQKFPSFRRAHRTLALIAVQRDQFSQAVAPLLKVISLGGGDGQAYGLLAYAYLTQEKYYSALPAYRMARMFNPESADFKRGEAQCLLMTDQHLPAIALFNELISENPGNPEFWLLQANSFLALNERDKAIANLEIATTHGVPSWGSLSLLGDLYMAKDVYPLALAAYIRAVKEASAPSFEAVTKPLSYLIDRGLYTEAKAYLGTIKAKGLTGSTPRELLELSLAEATLELRSGDVEPAQRRLKDIIAKDPLNGTALILLAEYYQRKDMFAEAELQLERAASVPEYQVKALVDQGRLLVTQRKYREAIVPLNKAQSLAPQANVARYIEQIQKAIDAE